MKYKIPKKQKGGFLLKENNSLDPIYEGGMIPAAVSSYKYTMEDYDNLASKKNLNQVPSVLQNGVMKARVRGAINKGVKDVLLPTIGVAAAPIISAPIISSAIASPSAFIGSMIGGIFGQVATDKIVQKTSGNKYSGWGDMVSKKTGLNPTVSEFTNPGGLIGGGLGTQTKKIIQKILPRYKQIPVKIDNNLIQKSITINKSIPKNNILNTPETFAKVTAQARENIKQLLDNPIVQETMVRNTELSKRLGIKFPLIPITDPNSIMSRTTSINEYRRMMLDKSINVKVDNLPLHVGANYNRSTKDLIYNWNKLKNAQIKDIDQFANHEVLHHGEFGTTRIESEKARRLLKSEKELDILANENPELLFIDQHYLRQPGETYTNVMGDLRTELGLKIGQSYPGKLNTATMLNNYNGNKKFVIDAFKLNTPRDYKRVWDALTGKYFTIGAGLTGGINQIKEKKKGGKLIPRK